MINARCYLQRSIRKDLIPRFFLVAYEIGVTSRLGSRDTPRISFGFDSCISVSIALCNPLRNNYSISKAVLGVLLLEVSVYRLVDTVMETTRAEHSLQVAVSW